jgi:glycosyltransferase involved in cell wall biosynthesis
MTSMLIISRYCGFDNAQYAGSQIHNYYLKRLHRDFTVKLVTVADPSDAAHLDFGRYGIDTDVIFVDERPRRALFFLLFNWKNVFNYFGKTIGLVNGYVHWRVLKRIHALRKRGYCPDCVLLEWTQIVLMAGTIKRLFPNAAIIAVEHDVCFQKFQRLSDAARGMSALKERLRFKSAKNAEISSLLRADLVVAFNGKDKDLLAGQGLPRESLHVNAPYFHDYTDVCYDHTSASILFFGAMDRPENYLSIIWFIERVYAPHLAEAYSLCVLGARPHPCLEKYRSKKITIAGFVPDIRPYLGRSVCKVAPLVLGAGIKVKVIEAMSAGLPVLANAIAIEGILAVDKVHYLHAEQPEEFLAHFDAIRAGRIDLRAISRNAKSLVAESFNLDKSYSAYRQRIMEVCGEAHPRRHCAAGTLRPTSLQ